LEANIDLFVVRLVISCPRKIERQAWKQMGPCLCYGLVPRAYQQKRGQSGKQAEQATPVGNHVINKAFVFSIVIAQGAPTESENLPSIHHRGTVTRNLQGFHRTRPRKPVICKAFVIAMAE
jgi:hypothetical protein